MDSMNIIQHQECCYEKHVPWNSVEQHEPQNHHSTPLPSYKLMPSHKQTGSIYKKGLPISINILIC